MLYPWEVRALAQADLERSAPRGELDELLCRARAVRPREAGLARRALVTLGKHLSAWGAMLQGHYGIMLEGTMAEQPIRANKPSQGTLFTELS